MAKLIKPKVKKETGENIRTFQLRLHGSYSELDAMSLRYNHAKHYVYGQSKLTGKPFSSFKEEVCSKFGLPSRVFNAIDKDLRGLASSSQEKAKFDIGQVESKLQSIARAIEKLKAKLVEPGLSKAKLKKIKTGLIYKQQSQKHHKARAVRIRARMTNPLPGLCFGSRKLFNAQHHLEANGYSNHHEWLMDWRESRSNQFMVVGSNDETSGNLTCKASVNEDISVSLKLFLGEEFGHLDIPNLTLAHGQADWVEAILSAQAEYRISLAWQKETKTKSAEMAEAGKSVEEIKEFAAERIKLRRAQPNKGHGIAYRFMRDEYGWRIFVTVTKTVPLLKPDFARGAIGVDLNNQFVSRTRVSAVGDFLESRDIPMITAGKTTGQRLARLHDIAHELVYEAIKLNAPIVIETLDFTSKKLRLREAGLPVAARRLSSFAYSKFSVVLKAHARLHGVCVVEVNPAYTSLIGAALHAVPNGLTVHGAAAMTIARRAMKVEETIPDRMRVWTSGRAPLSIQRPSCLRRKATVESVWEGWRELGKAVHTARALVQTKRKTGSQRRAEVRREAWLEQACVMPY